MGTILLMGAGLQTTVTGPTYDPDAQLFFNAQTGAGVTLTTTQMNAVNQWVVDAKAIGIWTKMKAVYPIVGGTATSHKFNLKNPLDTNAAFRLAFSGGGTHSSNGYSPGGVNGYANTFCATNSMLLNSAHISYYSRTNTTSNVGYEMSSYNNTIPSNSELVIKQGGLGYARINQSGAIAGIAVANSSGLFISNRTASNITKFIRNEINLNTFTSASTGVSSQPFYLGALNNNGSPVGYSILQCAFSTIGDGLTDLESQLLYQITEKYQVALSRNINTTQSFYYNSAYNNETNAFLFSTQITNTTIQTATNTLVTDLKTAGVFTKMKALYPMVGGTATTCKFNLVNPQDTDAAFRLNFVGGWTPSVNGMTPNGTNAYANTFLSSNLNLSLNSGHLSYYSRSNNVSAAIKIDMGSLKTTPDSYTDLVLGGSNLTYFRFNNTTGFNSIPATNTLGYFIGSRTASNIIKTFKDGVLIINGNAPSNGTSLVNFYIGATNNNGTPQYYSNNQCALSSIGDGLTDAEALATRTAVQNFQTTLGRQV